MEQIKGWIKAKGFSLKFRLETLDLKKMISWKDYLWRGEWVEHTVLLKCYGGDFL